MLRFAETPMSLKTGFDAPKVGILATQPRTLVQGLFEADFPLMVEME